MSTLTAQLTNQPYNISDTHFTLSVTQHKKYTAIDMSLFLPVVTMKNVPLTFDILYSELPSILKSKCFNDDHIPFATELKTTEMGHLFEHILLEYLCEEKLARGHKVVEYSGETDWNWIKDPRGTFHITISTKAKEMDILAPALEKTIKLFKIILNTEFMYMNVINQTTDHAITSSKEALSN